MMIDPEEPEYARLVDAFERIMEKHLAIAKPHKNFVSDYGEYFNELFGARALLYAVCVKEMTSNADSYTEDELEELSVISSDLSDYDENEEDDRIAVNECIRFFESKL